MCELFPGRIRALGTGIASAFGTLAAVLNPYYLGLIRKNGLNVFNLFFMMAITAITCLVFLPETQNQPLK
jgi:nitrate/nitrite transporter NarK